MRGTPLAVPSFAVADLAMAAVAAAEVFNPRIAPEELAGKFIVIDLAARDEAGRWCPGPGRLGCHSVRLPHNKTHIMGFR